jgi:putative transposase
MNRKPYPSDLTDEQWQILQPMIPAARPGGRPRKTNMRDVLDAIFYLTREGCSWRALPHDFPPWKTVYNYFEAWQHTGLWQRLLTALRCRVRAAAGRETSPRFAAIDSQSVPTALGGEQRGYDGNKKVKGRKRHICVDTLGLLLVVVVTAANVDDGVAAIEVFEQMPSAFFPRLEEVSGDHKYHNHDLYRWLRVHQRQYEMKIASRPEGQKGFVPLPRRWVVERTLAWLGKYRRLSKDYEHTVSSSEAVVEIAAIHHMLRRLAPVEQQYPFGFERPEKKAA